MSKTVTAQAFPWQTWRVWFLCTEAQIFSRGGTASQPEFFFFFFFFFFFVLFVFFLLFFTLHLLSLALFDSVVLLGCRCICAFGHALCLLFRLFFFFYSSFLLNLLQISDQAERELSSIFVSEGNGGLFNGSGSVPSKPLQRARTPSPSSVMDSPSPKRRLSSSSPFSPLMRAQNPSTNTSPDSSCLGEGAELGLLGFSPERARHEKRTGSFSGGAANRVLRMY
jgi:hypothetical protein